MILSTLQVIVIIVFLSLLSALLSLPIIEGNCKPVRVFDPAFSLVFDHQQITRIREGEREREEREERERERETERERGRGGGQTEEHFSRR